MERRESHRHRSRQDDNGCTDWSFCAWRETLVLRQVHATEGVLGSHALYTLRSFKVMAPQRSTVLEACAVAAKSGDARDKYFAAAAV